MCGSDITIELYPTAPHRIAFVRSWESIALAFGCARVHKTRNDMHRHSTFIDYPTFLKHTFEFRLHRQSEEWGSSVKLQTVFSSSMLISCLAVRKLW